MKWGILATGTIAKKFASTVEQMGAEGEQLVAVGSRHMESAQDVYKRQRQGFAAPAKFLLELAQAQEKIMQLQDMLSRISVRDVYKRQHLCGCPG